jgi:acyl dehydratase
MANWHTDMRQRKHVILNAWQHHFSWSSGPPQPLSISLNALEAYHSYRQGRQKFNSPVAHPWATRLFASALIGAELPAGLLS